MNSIIFKVDLQEETLSILFNSIHAYNRFGEAHITVPAPQSFIRDVIECWEECISKIKLHLSDKLWQKSKRQR